MQSITSSQIQPVTPFETEVESLEKLLSQIFSEQITVHELAMDKVEPPSKIEPAGANVIDFSPFFEFSLSSDEPENSIKSIIEADDSDRYAQVVEIQRAELFKLRAQERQQLDQIRSLEIEIASKDEQLQYLPEYFEKALILGEVQISLDAAKNELDCERLINEETSRKLQQLQEKVEQLKSTFWYQFASFFGLSI